MPSYGAHFPEGMEWQAGKTAASIKFYNEASHYCDRLPDGEERSRLVDAVEKIKTGELVLQKWTSPEDFLARDSD